jgi:protease-4
MAIFVKNTVQTPSSELDQNQSMQPIPRRRLGCWGRILIGFGVYVVLSVLLGWMLGDVFSTPAVVMEANSIYRIDLEGTVVEQGAEENPLDALMSEYIGQGSVKTIGLDDLMSNIELAKTSDDVLGIYLKGGELSIQPASAKALRDALLDFKQSGKFVIAYADAYSQMNYYIASVADKIFLNPVGSLAWDGLSAQKTYYKRLFDNLGIDMQILKVGTFKSAVEPYFRTSMSEEDRLQTDKYLGGIWDDMKSAVAESRSISSQLLHQYADEYMSLQPQHKYVQYGLVDTLLYVQDMDSVLRSYSGTPDYHMLSHSDMNNVERASIDADEKVAVIYAEGAIVDEGTDGIVEGEMLKVIKKIHKDDAVKAVVLRVNSPGGSADASEQIWHALETLKAKGLPVVVSMGDYAASGGYYISCGANYIYAEPTTLTGSIGIFGTVPNLNGLRNKIGIDIDTVSTNKHSSLTINAICGGMNPKEFALMQSMVERGYDLFTKRCAEGRSLSQDSIKAIGEGRVWLGKDAVQLGLVDELGNMNQAIQKAAELANIATYDVVYYPEKMDPMQELLKMFDQSTPEEQLMLNIKEFASKPRVMTIMQQVKIQ